MCEKPDNRMIEQWIAALWGAEFAAFLTLPVSRQAPEFASPGTRRGAHTTFALKINQ
jgi:hypothetical protein